ncbi:MAG: 50S ribosomal protein L5 [Deltaproteobacteria bacterium]|nr:50S ribosomal protein L5 [Deltaproteobacteria bacterium]
MQARIHEHYKNEVIAKLTKDFSYANVMMVPKLTKIVLNTSIKDAIQNSKLIDAAAKELTLIAGQKAVVTRARKSIANFKLREGMPIGAKVTLRGRQMWEFFDRLTSVAMPRIRDFRGLNPNGFDGRGNYNMGILEQIIFPEINYDDIKRINGMNITFVTTAKTDDEAYALLKALGMPLQDK